MAKANKYWLLSIIFLVVIIAIGSTIFWSQYGSSRPIEISLSPDQEWQGAFHISGAINNPGIYPVKADDSLEDIIQAAGGATSNADFSNLTVYLPETNERIEPQRIDINRADAWLLEALPGIGEVRAQAIIDYRCQLGPFCNINELTRVEGIGITIYEQLKHLITVADYIQNGG